MRNSPTLESAYCRPNKINHSVNLGRIKSCKAIYYKNEKNHNHSIARSTGEKIRPPSPENCTIVDESRTSVRVSCAESDYVDKKNAIYVLQVFDADTRRLLASATSMNPSLLEVTDLPAERSQSGLTLFLRIMAAHATSDATILRSQHLVHDGKSPDDQIFPGIEFRRYVNERRNCISSCSSFFPAWISILYTVLFDNLLIYFYIIPIFVPDCSLFCLIVLYFGRERV